MTFVLSSSAESRSPGSAVPGTTPPAPTGLEVRPFRALTYRLRDPEQLARVSSPAYDLVTPAGRERLADADPHNVVRLILPRLDGTAGEDGRSEASDSVASSAELAAATLRRWQGENVLVRDHDSALWLYEMTPPDGRAPTAGWLGAVTLPPPGSAAVLPHEDTYPVAVEGRRALLAATGTDLEPIVLAHDPDPAVAQLTAAARVAPPTLAVTDGDGVRHRLWRVTDAVLLGSLIEALQRTGAVIADGHHRFAAARAHAGTPGAPAGSDAVLALVTPMGPGGLRVDPIHRVVPALELDAAITAAEAGFRSRELPRPADRAALIATARRWLRDGGPGIFLLTDGNRLVELSEPTPEIAASVPADAPPAWRRLDVVLAHHGLFAQLWQRPDDQDSVLIAHGVEEALTLVVEREGVAVLLRAPSPSDVAAVARAGARMPRKSTLFVPKPRTGLVLRPLAD
ncbi:MAG: hypothetical protein QOJ68_165 [Blastococcus sp.]|jgi:uncharacterized protein (DUF1015 family)|nr:hypothetical protein [Blastococcus sp.]